MWADIYIPEISLFMGYKKKKVFQKDLFLLQPILQICDSTTQSACCQAFLKAESLIFSWSLSQPTLSTLCQQLFSLTQLYSPVLSSSFPSKFWTLLRQSRWISMAKIPKTVWSPVSKRGREKVSKSFWSLFHSLHKKIKDLAKSLRKQKFSISKRMALNLQQEMPWQWWVILVQNADFTRRLKKAKEISFSIPLGSIFDH